MILVAIDTALEKCSVGLLRGGEIVARERVIGRGHAEILMTELAALFEETGLPVAAVERIAVTIGPGSFTGLRVGISAARGFALVRAIPVIGISTLQAHAHRAAKIGTGGRPILALLPARGSELFGQSFSADAEPLGGPEALPAEAFARRAAEGGFAIAGAGALLIGGGAEPVHADSAPSIETVLALGAVLDPASHPPKPLYVKPPDAAPQARSGIARR